MGKACGKYCTKYINTEHSTTNIKPLHAVKKENNLWVNWQLHNNATKYRDYPKINEGDTVRANVNENKFAKGHERIGVQRGIKLLV